MSARLSLTRLSRDSSGLRLHATPGCPDVSLPEYSQFKYGDGVVSQRYGAALADLILPRFQGREVMVTSSGWGFVPPAAHSLVRHFVARASRHDVKVIPFRVMRSTVSNGDYASMTLEERQKAMRGHALSVDPDVDLTGTIVVALDDVRVTGVHEVAMDECLRAAGAAHVEHAYVVDAWEVREDPSTEAVLNASGVRSAQALLGLTLQWGFAPNARFCKRVLGMEEDQMEQFLNTAPLWVSDWIESAVGLDRLDQYDAYAAGAARLRRLRQDAPLNTQV